MPDLNEQMYCAEQIHIPPTFPYILKQYAKAAIRTQPYDLLRWSAAYFRAMATGDEPPVKVRLEYPPIELPSGLTPGYLKVLLKQFQNQTVVHEDILYDRWKGMCLNENALTEMLNLGNLDEEFEFLKFIAVATGHLTNSLSQTMVLLCELLTEEPEGGSAMILCDTFCDLYSFLARLDCGPQDKEEGDDITEEPTKDEEQNEVGGEVEEDQQENEKQDEDPQQPSEPETTADETLDNEPEAPAAEEIVQDSTVTAEENVAALIEEIVDSVPITEDPEVVALKARKEKRKLRFTAEVAGIGPVVEDDQIESVISYMKYWAARQEGMVMPRNVRHFLCPRLDPPSTVQALEAEK